MKLDKVTKLNSSRQKLKENYTVTDKRLKQEKIQQKYIAVNKNSRVTSLHMQCQTLLVNSETVSDK